MKPLVFRVDAGTVMGTGHVMRCLALAQAWQAEGGRTVFVLGGEAETLIPRLTAEGVEVERLGVQPGGEEDVRETAACANRLSAEWVVVDGYHFSGRYQKLLRKTGFRLLVLDDYGHAEHYEADLVLNQNLSAHESLYRNRAEHTRLLLGGRFVLLRREFVKWRGWRRDIPEVAHKVLVTLGGSDPDNVTLRVVQILRQMQLEDLEAVILVGAANPHRDELEAAVRSASTLRLQVNATDMPGLMAWADVAVAAGGTTTWELAFMGLPSLLLVLAENQREIAAATHQTGFGINLGRPGDIPATEIGTALHRLCMSAGLRSALTQRGREVVDGRGPERVCINLLTRSQELYETCVFRE